MDETFGIVADAARVKNFVKAVIKSNQRHEVWNEEAVPAYHNAN